MLSPERRGSLGKSVRWADEMDVTCLEREVDIMANRRRRRFACLKVVADMGQIAVLQTAC